MNRQRGFSLIELLIVLALLLIITAIAVPRFLRARISANEASTAASLKQIGIANAAYSAFYQLGYAGTLAQLGPPGTSCTTVSSACADLLDSLLSGINPPAPSPTQSSKSGYEFKYYAEIPDPTVITPNNTYAVVATPTTPESTGKSTFCFDNQISIIKDNSGALTSADFSGCAASWPIGGTVRPL